MSPGSSPWKGVGHGTTVRTGRRVDAARDRPDPDGLRGCGLGDEGEAGHGPNQLGVPGGDPRDPRESPTSSMEPMPARLVVVRGLAPDVPVLLRADRSSPGDRERWSEHVGAPLLELRRRQRSQRPPEGVPQADPRQRHRQPPLRPPPRWDQRRWRLGAVDHVAHLRLRPGDVHRRQRVRWWRHLSARPVLESDREARTNAAQRRARRHRWPDGRSRYGGGRSDLLAAPRERRPTLVALATTSHRSDQAGMDRAVVRIHGCRGRAGIAHRRRDRGHRPSAWLYL